MKTLYIFVGWSGALHTTTPWRTICESESCLFQSCPGWGVHGDMPPPPPNCIPQENGLLTYPHRQSNNRRKQEWMNNNVPST